MRFSLMTEPQIGGTYDELLAAARWAEATGLHSFARSDHYYSSRTPTPDATDAFATLAGLARDTARIRLCVLVTPITFRHPAVIAKTAATIDQMSGGRLDLGVGTGWMDLEHDVFGLPFPEWEERFDRLDEALAYLSAAFTGGRFEGRHYSIEADARPKPAGIKTIVGGSGPRRTPALTGRRADEYNHFVATAAEIGPKVDRMRLAAADAGRDPSSVEVTVMGPVLVGADQATYRDLLGRAASERDQTAEELEARWKKAGIPMGTGEQAAETLAQLEQVGVDRYYLQWLDLADLDGLAATWTALRG